MWLPSTGSGPEFIEGSTGFGFLIVGAIKQEMIRQFFVHVLFAYCLIAYCLPDYSIRPIQQGLLNRYPDLLCCLQIEDKFKLRRLLDGGDRRALYLSEFCPRNMRRAGSCPQSPPHRT